MVMRGDCNSFPFVFFSDTFSNLSPTQPVPTENLYNLSRDVRKIEGDG